jgi:rubredoxin
LLYGACIDRVVADALQREVEVALTMDRFVCRICGYVYDPEQGDPTKGAPPGTPFDALPDDWLCPLCGAVKEDFARLAEEEGIRDEG